MPFARQLFGNNYCYQDDNTTRHRARVVLDLIQQGNITEMEWPARSSDCNPIEHIWDVLGRGNTSMDNPPQNLGEPRQALLDKWAEIPVELLQCIAASMSWSLVVIIAARGENTQYWPDMQKKPYQKASSSKNQVCLTRFTTITIHWHLGMFLQPISAVSINAITNVPKIHIKQNSAYNL